VLAGAAHGQTLGIAQDTVWRTPINGNPALAHLAASRRVLLLQGPIGPFFDRLTTWLRANGTEVRRVVFHGGDLHDCRALVPDRFRGTPAQWPATVRDMFDKLQPDCIVLFGQARHYHKVALEHARAIDLPVVVLEEGYFRPGFATMELGGVNGYSTTLDRYEYTGAPDTLQMQPDACANHFRWMAWHASQHYLAMHRVLSDFPHYEHHRSVNLTDYSTYWIRSWFRKGRRHAMDIRFQQRLFTSGQPYFFVPLQLDGDSQISHHSPFRQTSEFVVKVLTSFAEHAPKGTLLVFKQHPHARGGKGNQHLIAEVAAALGVSGRVHHLVEGDTPDLAEHSRGTVVINSTVGLQALERGCSVLALGSAHYNRPGLSHQGPLDSYWNDPAKPDHLAAGTFLRGLKALTQVPASLYDIREHPIAWATAARV
jgi:capsular polysaccharide export protein